MPKENANAALEAQNVPSTLRILQNATYHTNDRDACLPCLSGTCSCPSTERRVDKNSLGFSLPAIECQSCPNNSYPVTVYGQTKCVECPVGSSVKINSLTNTYTCECAEKTHIAAGPACIPSADYESIANTFSPSLAQSVKYDKIKVKR